MFSEKIRKARSWKNLLSESEIDYLLKILSKLPHDSRIVIFLCYWRDLELDDIASILGISRKETDYIHDMTLQLLTKVLSKQPHYQNQMETSA